MRQQTITKWILAAFAAAVVGAATPVLADGADKLKGKAVKVPYPDINAQKEPGAHTLCRRLHHAANQACGVDDARKIRSARATSDAYRCYRKSLSASVKKVNNELLTRIHDGS